MSRLSKMSLKTIFEIVDLILKDNDIAYFCNDINIINEFMNEFNNKKNTQEKIKQFLIEREAYIDKEKLVLLLAENYRQRIEFNDSAIFKGGEPKNQSNKDFNIPENLYLQTKFKKLLKLLEGTEIILTVYLYDEQEERYKVKVIDSRKFTGKNNEQGLKNSKRFDAIEASFNGEGPIKEFGWEYIIQGIILSDLEHVFPSRKFGNRLRTMILENSIIKGGLKTVHELESLKTAENQEKYSYLLESVNFSEILSEIKITLKEYSEYIDIDKLLVIAAYRFNRLLEDGNVDSKDNIYVYNIIQKILESVKNSNTTISCKLENRLDQHTYENVYARYSVKDIKKCLSQFTDNVYVTTKEIEEYKNKVNNRELNLTQIEADKVDVIFSKQDLEEISTLSVENLIYVFRKNGWDTSKIIELYETNKISLDDVKYLKEHIDMSYIVNFKKLNSYYMQAEEKPEDEEILKAYNRYLGLYKEILISDKQQEDKEYLNLVMEQIIECFEGKEYEEAIKNYYTQGVITLGAIVEWSDKDIVTKLFDEGIINLEDIRKVGPKLGYDYMHNLYKILVYRPEIEYDKRIEYIESGLVDPEDVIKLYNYGLIMDDDLIKLAQKSVLSLEETQQNIDNRQLEDRIKTARAKALGWSDTNVLFHIDGLEKKQNQGVMYTGISDGNTQHKERLIINPTVRQEYIEKLGLYRIETECSEDNPFYHYEFYATPDESGAIGANSVIIAERYYQNKYDEKTFATSNATYFFKYKDFLVLSNLQKRDMIKEREGMVFRANHIIATNGKRGTWAENVLQNVLKLMLGADLVHLSEKERRKRITERMSQMYLREECDAILDLCKQIDFGEYNCRADGIQVMEKQINNRPSLNDGDDGYPR